MHFDFPINHSTTFRLEKDRQNENFGFKKFSSRVAMHFEQQFGMPIYNLQELKFTNADYTPIRKVSDISEGQVIICMFSEAMIQGMLT